MELRAGAEARQTYLVEHYLPGLGADELRDWAANVRQAIGELELAGTPVWYVRSTIVPADESLLCILEASSDAAVREAYARAGIPFERISLALPEEEGRHKPMTPSSGEPTRRLAPCTDC
jgi:hypothetical protein